MTSTVAAREPAARDSPSAAALTRQERRSLAGMAGFVLLLHVVGWGVLIFAVAPHDYQLGSTGVLGVGVGLTAYMLGVRHAFDADHIASIDNTTRKLVGEGRPSVSAGFWFSLGHSSVVFAASLLLVAGVRSVAGVVQDENSAGRPDPRPGRHARRRHVPGAHRADEPRRRRRHRPGLPADAHRRVRRGRARAAPAQPRLPGPPPRPGDPAGQQALAPLPGRPAHGPGLRHRDPGRPARARRRLGRLRAALVRDPRPAGALRRRDEPVRHRRRRPDVAGLRLGVPQADPEGLLQPDRHAAVGHRRPRHRRCWCSPACSSTGWRRVRPAGLGRLARPRLRRLRASSGCSCSPGPSRWRCGGSAASRSAGPRRPPSSSPPRPPAPRRRRAARTAPGRRAPPPARSASPGCPAPLHRDDDAALGGAVELGEDDAGDRRRPR